MVLTLIIGLANSIGLLIIGIDNPSFGFLGAALATIPYIGTTLELLSLVIYAFVSYARMDGINRSFLYYFGSFSWCL